MLMRLAVPDGVDVSRAGTPGLVDADARLADPTNSSVAGWAADPANEASSRESGLVMAVGDARSHARSFNK
jgi:hypothetical protein